MNMMQILLLVVQSILNIFIILLILRLMLQLSGIPFINRPYQMIMTTTNYVISPTQRVIRNIGRFELASLIWIIALQVIKVLILIWMRINQWPHPFGLFLMSLGLLGSQVMKIYFFAIIARVIISWFLPQSKLAIIQTIYYLTEPVLAPIHRSLPIIYGIDFSPLVAIIITQLMIVVVFSRLIEYGAVWMVQ